MLEHAGERVVVSGDYKRRPDPTCACFVPVPCDVFITEATFGLPVFRHPDTGSEIDRLLHRQVQLGEALVHSLFRDQDFAFEHAGGKRENHFGGVIAHRRLVRHLLRAFQK